MYNSQCVNANREVSQPCALLPINGFLQLQQKNTTSKCVGHAENGRMTGLYEYKANVFIHFLQTEKFDVLM